MDIYTIDFETYYDRAYSLSKMTTETYIRDPQFQVIGMGIKKNDGPVRWVAGEFKVAMLLKAIDFSSAAILCHNTRFDGAILAWHYDIKPKLWLDTMGMAKPFYAASVGVSLAALAKYFHFPDKGTAVHSAIGKRYEHFTPAELADYGEYCKHDTELCYSIFNKLKGKLPKEEFVVIDLLIRMFTEPRITLDTAVLEKHLDEVRDKKERLKQTLTGWAGFVGSGDVTEMLMSNDKLAEVLRIHGVEPPTKISAKTQKVAYAFAKTDQAFLDLQEHENPVIQAIVCARLGVKSTLEETRTAAFIELAKRTPDAVLPIALNYYGAHTGRFSGGEKLNLQNLPRGGALRKALMAAAGYVVITSDLAQIEARLLAYVAGQKSLVEAFANKRDVYSEFATDVYGRAITKADKPERFVGKTCILGLGYGTGKDKLRATLGIGQGGINVQIDADEAQRIVTLYRNKNDRIVAFWKACDNAIKNMAMGLSGDIVTSTTQVVLKYKHDRIILPNGMPIMYPGMKRGEDGEYTYMSRGKPVKIYGAKLVENIIQALAAILIRKYMVDMRKKYPAVLQVHDEIVSVVPEALRETAVQEIENIMSQPPCWAPNLPVGCEVGYGYNYGEAK